MTTDTQPIRTRYLAVDGYSENRKFKTLKGAQCYAKRRMGDDAEVTPMYAVTSDGVGTLMVSGATVQDLFPVPPSLAPAYKDEQERAYWEMEAWVAQQNLRTTDRNRWQ